MSRELASANAFLGGRDSARSFRVEGVNVTAADAASAASGTSRYGRPIVTFLRSRTSSEAGTA